MITQELIHITNGFIYQHTGDEIIEGSPEFDEFQSAENPEVLGYTFVEPVQTRQQRLAEALQNQNPHNP